MSNGQSNQVQGADARAVKEWYDRNEIVLVDVRETSEFEVEHIPGALLLPLSVFDPEMFPVLPGKKVVIHCAIGKRSEAAGKMLIKEGHQDVIHLTGGIAAWKAEGFATEVQILPPEPAPSAPQAPPAPLFLCPAPGFVLDDEYLSPLEISPTDLASHIGISKNTVQALLSGEISVDVELSLRLARYFSTAADFWVHLQMEHDLERARHAIGDKIRREISPRTSAL